MADLTERVTNLIGYLVKISAPGKRDRTGVVLPPRPGARKAGLRLAVAADRAIPFNPADWTIKVLHDDEYSYGNLPLELLAARTALRIEHNREPAPDQKPVAIYKRRDIADLYAIVDTLQRTKLSPARAAAWAEARTCAGCSKPSRRPLPELRPLRTRYCAGCVRDVTFKRWCEQSRAAQAAAAEWAREVLADPAAILIASGRGWNITHLRIETVGGALVFDGRVRSIDDLDSGWYDDTPEKKAERHQRYAGTIGPAELAGLAASISEARGIGWTERDGHVNGARVTPLPRIKPEDAVEDRLALFSGVAPPNARRWFPEPKIPWSYVPATYPPYTMHRELRAGESCITELAHLRTLLSLMAHNKPPAPSWINPTTRERMIAKDDK
jgi:hypothetical protein